jgi:5-methylcytosine-specific restriction endonuclease McrA
LRLLPAKKAQPREISTPVDEPPTPGVSVAAAPPPPAALQLAPPPSRATLEPVTADTYSLRVTVDAALEKDIEELKALLSHKIPNGDLTAVVREAIQCALEKHRKRKGAAEPTRKRKSPDAAKAVKEPVGGREPISAAVRREVRKRDEGRCTWRGPDGQRCGSAWQVELDHIRPAALGGASTVENLRLLCRTHNALSAEQVFGREHMEACRNKAPRTGEVTSSSGSSGAAPAASEPAPSPPGPVQRRLRM